MKKILILSVISTFTTLISSCGGNGTSQDVTLNSGPSSYDSKHGAGKFKDILLDEKLNETMAAAGNKSFVAKCAACHKLTEEKLVGPGWKGVTTRQLPSWIMNFITNTDEMINKDPAAQAQLEICLVRMPNQSLLDEEARNLLEFMRRNDGVK